MNGRQEMQCLTFSSFSNVWFTSTFCDISGAHNCSEVWLTVKWTCSIKLFLLLRPSFPLVIVHSSVMTMTPIAEPLSSALFTPGLLGPRRKKNPEQTKRNCEAGRDGRKVCGRKWEKESARQKERQWHFFFSCALFTSRMLEVKSAAREGESSTGERRRDWRRAMKGGWKKKTGRFGERIRKDKRRRRAGKKQS